MGTHMKKLFQVRGITLVRVYGASYIIPGISYKIL